MRLLYVDEIPFAYKKHKKSKDISLSEKLKTQFNNYYGEIKESDSPSIEKWTDLAVSLKSAVGDEVCEKGNKKSIYVEDYVQFIFGVSYLLFDKYKLSQKEVSAILGVPVNKYSKLGIFPQRCYQAYTKLDNISSRKSLKPEDFNSIGIQIAECINKKVQAVYACSAFVGVSNDLDLFANISTTDTKFFCLTSPLQFENDDIESIRRANYAFARYQFALGNQLFDDDDNYVPAGAIRDKIVQMLKMDDISVISPEGQDELIRKVLLSDSDLKAHMSMGYHYSEFQSLRDDYRLAYENMQIEQEKLEDGYINYLIEYYDTDYESTNKKDTKEFLENDEVVRKYYNLRKRAYEKREQELLQYINIPSLLRSKSISIKDWVEVIRKYVKENVIIHAPSENGVFNDKVIFFTPTYEDRLKCAASYWISEVFADYDGSDEFYKSVMTYLGCKSSLFNYFDALNALPSGRMKDASSHERKNIHIYMRDEKMDISLELDSWNIKSSKENERPLMVYLDKNAVAVSTEVIDKLVTKQKAIVIVHDKSKGQKNQLQELSQELGLYMKCSMEVE